MVVTLSELAPGQSGVVVGYDGGHGVERKLDAMGIRPGKRLSMVSSQWMSGPITVLLDGRQLAMGRGIASKIRVETRQ